MDSQCYQVTLSNQHRDVPFLEHRCSSSFFPHLIAPYHLLPVTIRMACVVQGSPQGAAGSLHVERRASGVVMAEAGERAGMMGARAGLGVNAQSNGMTEVTLR